MLGRALKMAFWVTYDHVGKLIVANLLWALGLVVPGFIAVSALLYGGPGLRLLVGVPFFVLTVGVILPVTTAGLAHMAAILIEKRDAAVADMLAGMRIFWRRAIGVGIVYLAAIASLCTSVWFYAAKLHESVPWLGYGISAVALWVLIFVVLTLPLAMPALVQKKNGVRGTLKLSALLVLDNPGLAIGLLMQVLAFTALIIPMLPLFFLLHGAVVVVMGSSAYEMLARKYAKRAAAVGGAYAAKAPGAGSIVVGARGLGAKGPADEDEQDDYLNRGVRDFFFPWKG